MLESVIKGRLSIQGLCVELSTLVREGSRFFTTWAMRYLPPITTRAGEYIRPPPEEKLLNRIRKRFLYFYYTKALRLVVSCYPSHYCVVFR